MMFAKYFEYYTIILRGAFFRGHAVYALHLDMRFLICAFYTLGDWMPLTHGHTINFQDLIH